MTIVGPNDGPMETPVISPVQRVSTNTRTGTPYALMDPRDRAEAARLEALAYYGQPTVMTRW